MIDSSLYASNDQIEAVLFRHSPTKTGQKRKSEDGAAYAANRALRQLWDAGYIERVWVTLANGPYRTPTSEMRFKQVYVNTLSHAGAAVLDKLYEAEEEPKSVRRWTSQNAPNALGIPMHEQQVHDFLMTARAACAPPPWTIWSVHDDRQLKQLQALHELHFFSEPDGFFVVSNRHTNRDFAFFLEIDLGTETVDSPNHPDFAKKITNHLRYLDERYDDDFFDGSASFPRPVILVVTSGPRRAAGILETIRQNGGGETFWVSTFVELDAAGFWGRCWWTAAQDHPMSLNDRCVVH